MYQITSYAFPWSLHQQLEGTMKGCLSGGEIRKEHAEYSPCVCWELRPSRRCIHALTEREIYYVRKKRHMHNVETMFHYESAR